MGTAQTDVPTEGSGPDRAALEARVEAKERELAALKARLAEWKEAYGEVGERDASFTTLSGNPVEPLYTPMDLGPDWDYSEKLGVPGAFPFTRGPYTTMYRTRLWTSMLPTARTTAFRC